MWHETTCEWCLAFMWNVLQPALTAAQPVLGSHQRIGCERGLATCCGALLCHATRKALWDTLMCALRVALVGLLWALRLVHPRALVEAATHTADGALAGDRCDRERAVLPPVAWVAQAGAVVAVAVVRAVVQASLRVAIVP